MVYKRLRLNVWTLDSQIVELCDYLLPNLVIVDDIFYFLALLNLNSKLHDIINFIDQLLEAFFAELELHRDIGSVNSSLQALNCSSGVCIRVNQSVFMESLKDCDLLVREDDVAPKCLSHQEVLA